jgi:hypothetical protein
MEKADERKAEVDAAREELEGLVDELTRRLRGLKKPALGVAIALAAAGGGYVLWRALRSKPSRLQRVGVAARRALAHPERVANDGPSLSKRIVTAAASALVTTLARRLAERL